MSKQNVTFKLGLHRENTPFWYNYMGDGQGRDNYIIFNNGGLNEQRMYHGSQTNGWKAAMVPRSMASQPHKEATAFDYPPDGSGRDLYIIRNYGLKRNYRSNYKNFECKLREEINTPVMDAKIKKTLRPRN
jgi:hypothetical protein